MGIALAEECVRRGAEVERVLGPISNPQLLESSVFKANPSLLHITHVESANDMYEASVRLYPSMDAGILCAAVADFTPETRAEQKIKRKGDDMVLHLKPTQDIAKALGQMKQAHQQLVGFALETNDEETNAEGKLKKKNFDFIVLNSLNDKGAGFRTDTNKITIIRADLTRTEYPLKPKTEVAADIVDTLSSLFQS